MELFYTVLWFLIGIIFGSFFHVVGYRLPKGESLLKPKHSYCPDCHHKLAVIDLIPIFSFLFTKGKCRYCKKPISIFYPVIELITGLLFALSYHLFGYSYEFIISIVLASVLSIVLVSDILYLVIPDEVIFIACTIISIVTFIFKSWKGFYIGLTGGLIMFCSMYLLMIIGSIVLRKECLGGADIKLMFLSGLVLEPILSLCVIFLSSVLALPIAIVLYMVNKEHVIPYGPFIVLAIFIIFISGIDVSMILDFMLKAFP